ncbi:hypothetical protein OSB04_un000001 [Centaurea solstitialis]|uniref:Uncharacterized protein n=1 Tax=Centaurea solstitialis TaxID=347529 RepID=A0AA38VVV6_9ASTR|nr:hypothetical protein OSB04_un000001 [Centaurea solstitialis]
MASSSSSSSSAIEIPVFIDTSLGTHIAISISPDLTAAEFKRKFESVHSNCYPGIGNIQVDGVMVKRKSYLYHLPESMPIKHVFRGCKKTWFLYTEAYPLNKKASSTPQSEVVHAGLSENRTNKNRPKSKRTRKGVQCLNPALKTNSRAVTISKTIVTNVGSFMEPTNDRLSESVSVSGIINKYFSVCDEVTSVKSKPCVLNYVPATPMPSVTMNVRSSRGRNKSSGVGKRLIVAANNLGVSTSDKKPMVSLCRYNGDKSSFVVRHPIFEISEG